MDQWMKWVWTLAAMAVVACLMALGHAGGGGYGTVATGHSGTSLEYFTMRDAARGTIEYGVHEGGKAQIYASRPDSRP